MSKTYTGIELLEAIKNGEIKEGTRFKFINNKNKATTTVIVLKDAMDKYIFKNEEFNDGLYANWLIDTTIESLNDNIDIQSIEEFKSEYTMSNLEFQLQDKINEVIRAVKQLDRQINNK